MLCASVAVPLDHSGGDRRSLRLHVEELPAAGSVGSSATARVMFLVAGGPGQGSSAAFDLKQNGSLWQTVFPGYTLVTYDDRGTGGSGRLDCPGLTAMLSAGVEETARIVGSCGRALGATGALYSTRANAADLDAVRAALGLERITLYGVSYGTKQVLAYALAYPRRVLRLVLDSVAPTDWPDAFLSDSLGAIPAALAVICQAAGCSDLGGGIPREFVTLANRLAVHPLLASIPVRACGPREYGSTGFDYSSSPWIPISIPASQPSCLLRSAPRPMGGCCRSSDSRHSTTSGERTCSAESAWRSTWPRSAPTEVFPWPAGTPLVRRSSLVDRAIAALPQSATAPFGRWAATAGLAEECKDWPGAGGGERLARGPLPNVPVLILAGTRDTRTPMTGARRVAADFPKAQVLVVPGAGHDLVGTSGAPTATSQPGSRAEAWRLPPTAAHAGTARPVPRRRRRQFEAFSGADAGGGVEHAPRGRGELARDPGPP